MHRYFFDYSEDEISFHDIEGQLFEDSRAAKVHAVAMLMDTVENFPIEFDNFRGVVEIRDNVDHKISAVEISITNNLS